jgi:hypothetical protein
MRYLLHGVLACLVVVPLTLARITPARAVPLHVDFKLTDEHYEPLAGVPVRLVFGAADWQAPDAGTRIVTAADGTATFTVDAVVDRRWQFRNVGFTPFSWPVRTDHVSLAAELEFVLPKKDGPDAVHRWLYTAEIDRDSSGDCSTDDLDKVYEAGPDGRFTRLVGANAAGPNFDVNIDGWALSSAGYKLSDFMLEPQDTAAGEKRWHLKLAIVRRPKAVLP